MLHDFLIVATIDEESHAHIHDHIKPEGTPKWYEITQRFRSKDRLIRLTFQHPFLGMEGANVHSNYRFATSFLEIQFPPAVWAGVDFWVKVNRWFPFKQVDGAVIENQFVNVLFDQLHGRISGVFFNSP
jgi:hypothetical protein